MYAIKCPHVLNKCYQQIFSSFCFPALLRQSSHHVFALENPEKASSMAEDAHARAAIQRHSMNLEMFGPAINDSQKDVVKNKQNMPISAYNMEVVSELNDKEHLSDLQDPELNNDDRLYDMVKNLYRTNLKNINEEKSPFPDTYLNVNELTQVVSFLISNKQSLDNDLLSLSQIFEYELKMFQPFISDDQKHEVKNKKVWPKKPYMDMVPELNGKDYLADLQVPELNNVDKLFDMVNNIYLTSLQRINEEESPLPNKYLNANKLSQVVSFLISNKQSFDNDLLTLYKMTEDELEELDDNKKKHVKRIDRRHIRSHSSDTAKNVTTGTVIKLPLYNIRKSGNKEETNKLLQTRIPKDVCLEKYSVNYILEKTSSGSVKKGKRESPFGNTEKKLIEEKLRSYFTPSDLPGPDIPPALYRYWQSMKPVLQKMHNVCFNVGTTHPVLKYFTQADIICYFENDLVVMDWKSLLGLSSSPEDIVDAELKTIACVGALHFDPNVNYEQRLRAAVLVSNGSGSPADVLVLKSDAAITSWTKWIERFQSFYEKKF